MLQLAVRLPDGRRGQRRFMDSDTVAAVEAWLHGEGLDMSQHVLSRQWPRKVSVGRMLHCDANAVPPSTVHNSSSRLLVQLLSDGVQTLAAAGLQRNEMLVLVQRP